MPPADPLPVPTGDPPVPAARLNPWSPASLTCPGCLRFLPPVATEVLLLQEREKEREREWVGVDATATYAGRPRARRVDTPAQRACVRQGEDGVGASGQRKLRDGEGRTSRPAGLGFTCSSVTRSTKCSELRPQMRTTTGGSGTSDTYPIGVTCVHTPPVGKHHPLCHARVPTMRRRERRGGARALNSTLVRPHGMALTCSAPRGTPIQPGSSCLHST
jgi:hypothetical protein